jgi:hypothetical protein
MSVYVRANNTDITATLNEIREESVATISAYASSHNIDYEFAVRWVSCSAAGAGGCSTEPPSDPDAMRWWGANRTYSMSECAETIETVVSTLAAAAPEPMGSLVPDSGLVCNEGPPGYLQDALDRIRETPMRFYYMYSTVEIATCASRGYRTTRDPRDECWPETAKMMHTENEEAEMQGFVMGPPGVGLRNTLLAYDALHELPEFTAIDLVTCHVCELGGANRDRGMLRTLSGSAYTPIYTSSYCANAISNAGLSLSQANRSISTSRARNHSRASAVGSDACCNRI